MLKKLKIEIITESYSAICRWERYTEEGKLMMQPHTHAIGPTADLSGLAEQYPLDYEKIVAHIDVARMGYVAPVTEEN